MTLTTKFNLVIAFVLFVGMALITIGVAEYSSFIESLKPDLTTDNPIEVQQFIQDCEGAVHIKQIGAFYQLRCRS